DLTPKRLPHKKDNGLFISNQKRQRLFQAGVFLPTHAGHLAMMRRHTTSLPHDVHGEGVLPDRGRPTQLSGSRFWMIITRIFVTAVSAGFWLEEDGGLEIGTAPNCHISPAKVVPARISVRIK